MRSHDLRRTADIARLRELERLSQGRLRVVDAPERAGRPIRLHVDVTVPASPEFPARRQRGVTMRLDLPARYPFERPVITIETPVFHPNVFASGVICQGDKWLPGHGIDLIVQRMIDLVTYAPMHVNPSSAANRTAADWYLAMRRQSADVFPTDTFKAVVDAGAAPVDARARLDAPVGRVIVACPHCATKMRLPAGRRGTVQCPSCQRDFTADT